MRRAFIAVISTVFLASSVGGALAQNERAAPGTPSPDTPRAEPNGDKSPAPSATVTGGVGENSASAPTQTQTKTGGPSGGAGRGSGGGG